MTTPDYLAYYEQQIRRQNTLNQARHLMTHMNIPTSGCGDCLVEGCPISADIYRQLAMLQAGMLTLASQMEKLSVVDSLSAQVSKLSILDDLSANLARLSSLDTLSTLNSQFVQLSNDFYSDDIEYIYAGNEDIAGGPDIRIPDTVQ